jgi:membrane-associated phospholipid phosphatase
MREGVPSAGAVPAQPQPAQQQAGTVGWQLSRPGARRGQPDRDSAGVPAVRRVPMPASASFPSGHTASGLAFTNAVAHTLPAAAGPLGHAR